MSEQQKPIVHNIYVASSWKNLLQPGVVRVLRAHGHTVYDFRNPGEGKSGFSWAEIDPEWQKWDTEAYLKALKQPRAEEGFKLDMDALRACTACVYVLPCGRSASLEAGWAAGAGKLTIGLMSDAEPELMAKMFDVLTPHMSDVLEFLAKTEPKVHPWDFMQKQFSPKSKPGITSGPVE